MFYLISTQFGQVLLWKKYIIQDNQSNGEAAFRRFFVIVKFHFFLISFQASGVSVTEDVKLRFDDIKKKKKFRYAVFFIKDEKAIAVETTGTKSK